MTIPGEENRRGKEKKEGEGGEGNRKGMEWFLTHYFSFLPKLLGRFLETASVP